MKDKHIKLAAIILFTLLLPVFIRSSFCFSEEKVYNLTTGEWEYYDSFEDFENAWFSDYYAALGLEYHPENNTSQQATPAPSSPAQESPTPVKTCDHHYVSEIITDPTCAEVGMMKFTCDKCGDSYEQEIPATGKHDYVSEVTTEATCEHTGIMTYTCNVCGDTYTEIIPKEDHDYVGETTTAPTCTEPGVKTYTCSKCGDTYTEELPAMGHSSDGGKVVKPSGYFTEGLKEEHCVTCGELLSSEVIPSIYPIYYLYIIIGVGVAVVLIAVITIVKVRKNRL